MTVAPALLAWRRPRSSADLERLWRRAAAWAGADPRLDAALEYLRWQLDGLERRRMPRPYVVAMLRRARRAAWRVWYLLAYTLAYAEVGGLTTEYGRAVAAELRLAARVDHGMGWARRGRVLPVAPPMPEAGNLGTCPDYALLIPPVGDAVEFAPAVCDGFEGSV